MGAGGGAASLASWWEQGTGTGEVMGEKHWAAVC